MTEQAGEHDQHETDGGEDQEIANSQNRALKVRHGPRLLHEAGGLAEIGVHAGGRDGGIHLALFRDGA